MFMKKMVFGCVFLLSTGLNNQVYAMQKVYNAMQKVKAKFKPFPTWAKYATTVAALYGLGTTYDYLHQDKFTFVDVSTPSKPQVLEEHFNFNLEDFEDSVTKSYLEKNQLLKNPVFYAKSKMSKAYPAVVDAELFAHSWVFLPTMRKKLTHFVLHLSLDESEQHRRKNICLVHGTAQGASVLLRTVFDEVLNQRMHQNFVKLRDDTTVASLTQYPDVNTYYDELFQNGKRVEKTRYNPAGYMQPTGEFVTLFDKSVARDHLLSVNYNFFQGSSWLQDGYMESSAEFVTKPCSWGHQALDCLPRVMSLNPIHLVHFVQNIAKPGSGTEFGYDHLANVFKAHDALELYPLYKKELEQMQSVASAGLVHLFMPQDLVARWCYRSLALGIRSDQGPQMRVLLHPDLHSGNGVSMRFYLLGDQNKIKAMLHRMYEIAKEVRKFKNK